MANLFVSDPLFLRSVNAVPVNLHQTNVLPCFDKKGRGPEAQLLPSKVPVLPSPSSPHDKANKSEEELLEQGTMT